MPLVKDRQTERVVRWLKGLRDLRGRAKVLARIERSLAAIHGTTGPVGGGVPELRINYGPGYRIYSRRRAPP